MEFFTKENKFDEALEKFNKASQVVGLRPGKHYLIKNRKIIIKKIFISDISYNIAVCYYHLKHYDTALKHIADIIEKGIKEHPGTIF